MVLNDKSKGLVVTEKMPETVVYADGSSAAEETPIVKEHFMDLLINEQLAAKLVCTPSDLPQMVIGRMKTEGFIQSIDDVELLYLCEYGSKAKVFLKEKIELESRVAQEPTCCTGNQVFLAHVDGASLRRLEPADWKEEWIFRLAEAFAGDSKLHRSTGGTHSCYLAMGNQILYSAEDIGRHNAMDKAIGYAVMNRLDLSACMLYTSGRVPTDMVKKAVGAGIPILISKTVPTDQAIEMAAYYNLTLICRARPDRFEVFHRGT